MFSLHPDTETCSLVSGGRWFLAAHKKAGFIDYYDLDAKNPLPRVLNIGNAGYTGFVDLLVISINHEVPTLDFNLAFNSYGPECQFRAILPPICMADLLFDIIL